MKTKLFTISIAVLIVALLSGCASLPNSTTEKINNNHIEFAMTQHHTVPVVFENGLGGRMEGWKKVLSEISKDTTTFAYNRPGYGESDSVLTPRDGSHVVDELRSMLLSKGLTPYMDAHYLPSFHLMILSW